jgi:hypothetical protein
MGFYKLIKIRGAEGSNTGYFVPRLYRLRFAWWELKIFGLRLVKERLKGWSIWWVDSEESYRNAVDTLEELRKTRIFDYKVSTELR